MGCFDLQIPRISRILLTDPSFQIATMEFAIKTDRTCNETDESPNDETNNENTSADPEKTDGPLIKFCLQDCKYQSVLRQTHTCIRGT